MKKMGGWKTWTGAALIAASAVLKFLGHIEIAEAVMVADVK